MYIYFFFFFFFFFFTYSFSALWLKAVYMQIMKETNRIIIDRLRLILKVYIIVKIKF